MSTSFQHPLPFSPRVGMTLVGLALGIACSDPQAPPEQIPEQSSGGSAPSSPGSGGNAAPSSGGSGPTSGGSEGAAASGGTTSGGAVGSGGEGNSAGSGGTSEAGTGGSTGAVETEVGRSWTNPIIPERADPHIVLHEDGYYYLTATVPAYDLLELRRAQTLEGLGTATPKEVWKRPASGEMAGNIWAPEIHFVDDKWYIYFSAGVGGAPWDTIRLHAVSNPSPNPLEGNWTVEGKITTKWDTFTLDATTFEHQGVRYLVWTQVEPNVVGTNIMIAEMDSPISVKAEQVILSRPEFDWETRGGVSVNEAPSVLVKNGKVFITFSASATDANYCMGLLTAEADANLLDVNSWSKSPQPVFQSNEATSQFGPGHNSFTTTPDGIVDLLVYHTRDYKDLENPLGNPDRATRAQQILWKSDGTPDFGVPVAAGLYQVPLSTP